MSSDNRRRIVEVAEQIQQDIETEIRKFGRANPDHEAGPIIGTMAAAIFGLSLAIKMLAEEGDDAE